jgi:hypothetical protein
MKKIWGMSGWLLTCGIGLAQFACSSAAEPVPEVVEGDRKLDDLIGSVPVNSASLDAIGAIGFVYEYNGGTGGFGGATGGFGGAGLGIGGAADTEVALSVPGPSPAGGSSVGGWGGGGSSFYARCTGTLISKSSVLTSRSCAQLFEQTLYGYSSLKFSIGADSTEPTRLIDVVDVEYAPGVATNGGFSNPDIGVLHLGESITDVTPLPVALLTDDLIGKPFAGVGFGSSDLRYRSGERRAGSLVLRGTSGLLYPLIFDTFEAFYAYVNGSGYYPGIGGFAGVASDGIGGASSAGSAGSISAGGFPSAGFGGLSPSAGTGGGYDDWYRQYLEQQYNTTELAAGEVYLGGTDSDAQPCGADLGGPMARKLGAKVRVFGVFSRTPLGVCEKGALYASINPGTKAFVDAAAQWKDPCTDLTSNGKCVGNVATRCSSNTEGKRRAVKFDCTLLNQVCVAGVNTEVACADE